jgi:hypothetical protein
MADFFPAETRNSSILIIPDSRGGQSRALDEATAERKTLWRRELWSDRLRSHQLRRRDSRRRSWWRARAWAGLQRSAESSLWPRVRSILCASLVWKNPSQGSLFNLRNLPASVSTV